MMRPAADCQSASLPVRWRLPGQRRARLWAWALGAVALFAIASVGLLWAAERSHAATSQKTTKAKAAAKPPAPAQVTPAPPRPPAASGGIEIVSPESGAKLRGVAPVRVAWEEPAGYVIFRVDGEFAYATASPFEMRWDTSTACDGEHVITADAYDANADYEGTSSIKVAVENAIATPPEGLLLQVRFKENDVLTRRYQAKSELSALTANQGLPAGFDVLACDFDAELSQSVMDIFYEGTSSLVRNRLREGDVTVDGRQRHLPEVGQYAMVQISRNGLALPATAAVSRPRLGLGEISLALPDYPVFPGDEWESPLGAVCDVYTRRAVFVPAQHTFEGLRWFRGRECAVITSSYAIPKLTLLQPGAQTLATAASASAPRERAGQAPPDSPLTLDYTQGPMGGRGMRRAGGGGQRQAGGRRQAGGAAARGTARAATPGAQPGVRQGAAGAPTLDSVSLLELKGTRRTFLTRASGRVMHTEDTILGKVEFRTVGQQARASDLAPYSIALTQMRGGGRRGARGGGGMARRGAGGAGAATRRGTRAATPAARQTTQGGQAGRQAEVGRQAEAGRQIPPELLYGLRLTGDLVIK